MAWCAAASAPSTASSSTSDQRPAASGGPSAVRRPGRGRWSFAGRFQRRARSGAKVSFVTSPAQTRSQSASSTSRSDRAPDAREQLPVEAGAATAEVGAQPLVELPSRPLHAVGRAGGPQQLPARPQQDHAAVVPAKAPPPHPGDLAHGAQLVEEPRLVAGDARREDVPLQDGRRDRQARELVHDLREALQRRGATER